MSATRIPPARGASDPGSVGGAVTAPWALTSEAVLNALDADPRSGLDPQEVARRLGIGRSTLYRKLKDFGLDQHATETDAPTDEDHRRASAG